MLRRAFLRRTFVSLALSVGCAGIQAAEPALPPGLETTEPALPGGLEDDEPALPDFGAMPDTGGSETEDWALTQTLGLTGFWELRGGVRLRSPVAQRHSTLAETRLALSIDGEWQGFQNKLALDALYDDIADSGQVDLERGSGWLDLREAWTLKRLGAGADLKAGRQILTWGVGDLLFINDLFPKDWHSFLAGREEQYLKAPSDALRIGVYSEPVNLNLVYTPRFDSDRFIDGSRLSYFSALDGAVVGRNGMVAVNQPDHTGEDDELALRLYRNLDRYEIALYGYYGFWKSPAGFDPAQGLASFPGLRVHGASMRGPAGPGLLSMEIGHYDSRDDQDGTDPLVNNSEWRALLGYEWELATNTTLGLQYYLETLLEHDQYLAALAPGQQARDRHRQVLTARVTHLAMSQNLTLSLFGFYSTTDRDWYLRPGVHYKATDNWLLQGGLNVFGGAHEHSFFGQFESNSNVFLALRYSF
jgi:hypothetical protein